MNGGDLVVLQHIMGHSSVEMTRIYVYLTDEDLKQKNQRLNPIISLVEKGLISPDERLTPDDHSISSFGDQLPL